MDRRASCPQPDQIRALIDGGLSAQVEAQWAGHLAGCAACRAKLDEIAAGAGWLAQASDRLARGGETEPALRAAMQQLKAYCDEPTRIGIVSEPTRFSFVPSENPAHLGKLDRYEIVSLIGRGGMGAVFRAYDPTLQRYVAIKVLNPRRLAADASLLQRFLREARAAAAIDHDHVVTIYEVNQDKSTPYLVMQLVTGTSLQQRIDRDGALPLREVVRIGAQVAAGLAAAHAQGLVHRDVKPSNILIEAETGRAKITDFGLARSVDDVGLTQPGLVAGTPGYMAPEQARGGLVDHRADLFNLGSVLYAACCGRAAFQGTSTESLLRGVCETQPTQVTDINPAVPEWLAAIIERLHAKDPAQRFQSAQEVTRLLSRQFRTLRGPASEPAAPTEPAATEPPAEARRGTATPQPSRTGIPARCPSSERQPSRAGMPDRWPPGEKAPTASQPAAEAELVLALPDDDSGAVLARITVERARARRRTRTLQWAAVAVCAVGFGVFGLIAALNHTHQSPVESPAAARSDRGSASKPPTVAPRSKPTVPAPAVPSAHSAFVLAGPGIVRAGFAALDDAVAAAPDRAIIEIHGNGPFPCRPIDVGLKSLTIRAAPGFRPELTFAPESPGDDRPALNSLGRLVLEGIEWHAGASPNSPGIRSLVRASGPELHVAYCRFAPGDADWCIDAFDVSRCRIRNCEFVGRQRPNVNWSFPAGGRLELDGCMHLGGTALVLNRRAGVSDGSLALNHDTWAGEHGVHVMGWIPPQGEGNDPRDLRLRIDAVGNVFDLRGALLLFELPPPPQAFAKRSDDVPALAARVRRCIAWTGRKNLYDVQGGWIRFLRERGPFEPPWAPQGLTDWQQLWPDSESLAGPIQYGPHDPLDDLLDAAAGSPLSPSRDFVLAPLSLGHAADAGRSLGMDSAAVGPGAAYHAWRRSPEYRRWEQSASAD